MKILILGSGAREHALGYAVKKEGRSLYFLPGNAGTQDLGKNIDLALEDKEAIVDFAKKEGIDFTLVGPEAPLVGGIVDAFQAEGLKIFGPKAKEAQLEGSKTFAKDFCNRHGLLTAKAYACQEAQEIRQRAQELLDADGTVVLKADGLAGGKGVVIAKKQEDIEDFIQRVQEGAFGEKKVLVEEFIPGFEVSIHALVDGQKALLLPSARDHKKIYDNEKGPNTGGMGTYSPNDQADIYQDEIEKDILAPFMEGLKKDGLDFHGVIFIGCMISQKGIYVLEFNVRFGDPETQSILNRIDEDILDLFQKTMEGNLPDQIKIKDNKVLTLVLASQGYPLAYEKGREINLEDLDQDVLIYHGGTSYQDGKLVTSGGRVLSITGQGQDFEEVKKKVYQAAEQIHFEGKTYRKDIGPTVSRVYVAKKDPFQIEAKNLETELEELLGHPLKIKVYQRYDIEGLNEEEEQEVARTILAEPPVDDLYLGEDALQVQKDFKNPLVVQYHQGQFDQRNQGVLDTILVTLGRDDLASKTAKVYDFDQVTPQDMEKIRTFLVNPVDEEEGQVLGIPTSLKENFKVEAKNPVYQGFIDYSQKDLQDFLEDQGLAMSLEDLALVQDYFKDLGRDPNVTEIGLIDTYWSDHCRHTTFNTVLDIQLDPVKTKLDETIQKTLEDYLDLKTRVKKKKPVTLMDLGTIVAKYLKEEGICKKIEVSDEINACSVYVDVTIEKDGREEVVPYLLMFKNETHNHPTEIEPFGGASTCLGGAIRDPLSGRSYVYQSMRVTGAGDPFTPLDQTLKGKLPQRKICQNAAKGYSSYGNQIGLTTGLVEEWYHPGYLAKRMEVGAVMGAAPQENVKRLKPAPGDLILLVGGRTGRDGIGGATGSSKAHDLSSITESSAEVQKGNAPMERKLQRLFRNPQVAQKIKKCNDFGAGGVSVAIGELADSLDIDLDQVPLKYLGLQPKEIALSESQERMAILIDAKDLDFIKKACVEENVEASLVAKVTDTGKLHMTYRGQTIVDLDRSFLDSAGASRENQARISSEDLPSFFLEDGDLEDLPKRLEDLNMASQKNLIERFDTSIGRGSLVVPLGGRDQLSPVHGMAALIPSLEGQSKTGSIMAYGFNPFLADQSQFLAGYYGVLESLANFVALGGDIHEVYLSFQEYFEKLGQDPQKWSKPLKTLLGAFSITKELEIPVIGGKDSMSGSFEDLNVPPTFLSFACGPCPADQIMTPELKGIGKIGLLAVPRQEDGRVDLDAWLENLETIKKENQAGNILSLTAINHRGILVTLFEMAIGNRVGLEVKTEDFFLPRYGDFILEYKEDIPGVQELGTCQGEDFTVNGRTFAYQDLLKGYLSRFDSIYSPTIQSRDIDWTKRVKIKDRQEKSKHPVAKPKVIIPVFPGTNCEYDTAAAFEKEGAQAEIFVFNTLSPDHVNQSIQDLAEKIKSAQILALPGGFSMGDEPDGSGKFIANVLRNPKIKEAIDVLLKDQDGLMLGICNGFQALIKTGYLPYGQSKVLDQEDPTLHYNNSNRHIAKFVQTKVLSNKSPWTRRLSTEKDYLVPISHGEGRVIISESMMEKLLEGDQIATVYKESPNGSFYGIEGLMSPDGKILGKMGHSERVCDQLYKNIPDVEIQEIIGSGVDFMRRD